MKTVVSWPTSAQLVDVAHEEATMWRMADIARWVWDAIEYAVGRRATRVLDEMERTQQLRRDALLREATTAESVVRRRKRHHG